MTKNFDGMENLFYLSASLDPPLKRRDFGWHTHSKQLKISVFEYKRKSEPDAIKTLISLSARQGATGA